MHLKGGGGGGGGNRLCRSLSTRRGSPFMGKHFRCKVYTGGRLSLGVAIVKKAELWLCNISVKYWINIFCNILSYEVVIKLIEMCFENNIKCLLNVNKWI